MLSESMILVNSKFMIVKDKSLRFIRKKVENINDWIPACAGMTELLTITNKTISKVTYL